MCLKTTDRLRLLRCWIRVWCAGGIPSRRGYVRGVKRSSPWEWIDGVSEEGGRGRKRRDYSLYCTNMHKLDIFFKHSR